MGPHVLRVMNAAVAGTGGGLYRPAVFGIEHQRHLGLYLRATNGLVQLLKPAAHLLHVPELPCAAVSAVVHHRPVELLRGAPALPELEVLHRVGPVSHGLHAGGQVHTRTLEAGDRPPVDDAGGGLHQQKGLLFQGAHHIVPQGEVRRRGNVLPGALPLGVGVPGDHVQQVLELEIVVVVEIIHQIGGNRDGGIRGLHRVPLGGNKVRHLVRDKALPVQAQAVNRLRIAPGAPGSGSVDFLPAVKGLAPEIRPPLFVEGLQRAVLLLQPLPESGLAQLAAAFAPIFVGEMPQNHPRVFGKALGQNRIDCPHLLPVDRGGVAVVVPPARELPLASGGYPADLRVLFAHPAGLGARRGGQHGVDAVFVKGLDDLLQPVQLVHPLLGLQLGPGENAQGDAVDVGLFHQGDILFQNIRAVQPLVGVVVAAVEQVGKFGGQGSHRVAPFKAHMARGLARVLEVIVLHFARRVKPQKGRGIISVFSETDNPKGRGRDRAASWPP